MVPTDGSWVGSGLHNGVPYIVVSDRGRFESVDKGGSIYALPVETFEVDLTNDQIKKSPDYGLTILKSMQSENQKLNRNIKSF